VRARTGPFKLGLPESARRRLRAPSRAPSSLEGFARVAPRRTPLGPALVYGQAALGVGGHFGPPPVEEEAHDLDVTPHGGPVEGRVVGAIDSVDVGPLVEEAPAHGQVPVVRGPDEGGLAHHVALLEIGAGLDEELNAGQAPRPGGQDEGGVAAGVALVEGGAVLKVLRDPVDVAVDAVAPNVGLFGDESPSDKAEGHRSAQSLGGAGGGGVLVGVGRPPRRALAAAGKAWRASMGGTPAGFPAELVASGWATANEKVHSSPIAS